MGVFYVDNGCHHGWRVSFRRKNVVSVNEYYGLSTYGKDAKRLAENRFTEIREKYRPLDTRYVHNAVDNGAAQNPILDVPYACLFVAIRHGATGYLYAPTFSAQHIGGKPLTKVNIATHGFIEAWEKIVAAQLKEGLITRATAKQLKDRDWDRKAIRSFMLDNLKARGHKLHWRTVDKWLDGI